MKKETAITLVAAAALAFVTVAPASAMARKMFDGPNIYQGNPSAIDEGRKLYIKMGCNICHGTNGEGNAKAPANNDDRWKFGSDNATLRKLISGQQSLQTMPSYADAMNEEQIDKVLAYVRSFYVGDPTLINW